MVKKFYDNIAQSSLMNHFKKVRIFFWVFKSNRRSKLYDKQTLIMVHEQYHDIIMNCYQKSHGNTKDTLHSRILPLRCSAQIFIRKYQYKIKYLRIQIGDRKVSLVLPWDTALYHLVSHKKFYICWFASRYPPPKSYFLKV